MFNYQRVPYVRYISGDVPKKYDLIWYSSCSLGTWNGQWRYWCKTFYIVQPPMCQGKRIGNIWGPKAGDKLPKATEQLRNHPRESDWPQTLKWFWPKKNGVLQWIQHKDAMITQNWHDIWDIWDVLNQQNAGNCCGFRFERRFSGPPKFAHGDGEQLGTVLLQSLTSPGQLQKSSPGMSWDSVQTFQSHKIAFPNTWSFRS